MLLQRGYKLIDLYEMTLYELKMMLQEANKGLAYKMWKQATLTISMLTKNAPSSPESGSPELYPARKKYKMPEWMRKKYLKVKGVEEVNE